MTRKGFKELSAAEHRRIARLVQLHTETHPARLATKFGLTPNYIQGNWTNMPREEMAPIWEALAFAGIKP